MTVETTAFDTSRLGRWGDPIEFRVEREHVVAYSAATNDPLSVDRDSVYAPPIYAVVPAHSALIAAVRSIVPDRLFPRGVHGEQDMVLNRPIEPGQTLAVTSAGLGVRVRSSGTVAIVGIETRTTGGELVNRQWMSFFVRGVFAEADAGEEMPVRQAPAAEGAPVDVTAEVDEDQTFRYADASGDHNPIHVDDVVAQSVGLPGVIVHGLCTMAFAARAVLAAKAGGDPTRLRRIYVRFARPLLPGQAITTTVRGADLDGDRAATFETRDAGGTAVIRDGWARLTGGP